MPTHVAISTLTSPRMNHPHYACLKCPWWFKNKSGLTQHTNAIHPDLTHPLSRYEPQDQDFDEPPLPHPNSPARSSPPVQGEHDMFVGPNNQLYRNYHLLFNGKLAKSLPLSIQHRN